MSELVAAGCVIAGLAVVALGYLLGKQETELRKQTQQAFLAATKAFSEANAVPVAPVGEGEGIASRTHQQSKDMTLGAAEFVKALGEFARSLSGVDRTVQCFLIATIFFFIAGAIVVTEAVAT